MSGQYIYLFIVEVGYFEVSDDKDQVYIVERMRNISHNKRVEYSNLKTGWIEKDLGMYKEITIIRRRLIFLSY